jgi:vacuolar protein sorting-associated protein 13A/C
MEGPLEGGLGILKGTAGIINYTAASMAGSIGKMTNTMNKGLIMLSGDKEYIH